MEAIYISITDLYKNVIDYNYEYFIIFKHSTGFDVLLRRAPLW